MRAHIFLAVVVPALPLPAAAQTQPASWATDRREPLCVFDGLMANSESDAGRVERIQAECQRRFGWTEHQGSGGVAAAYLMATAMQAREEAIAAGVSIDTMQRIMATFSEDEKALLAPSTSGSQENARRFARLLHERVTAAGLTGQAGNKAAYAIVTVMTAARMISDFSREIGFNTDQIP